MEAREKHHAQGEDDQEAGDGNKDREWDEMSYIHVFASKYTLSFH